MSSRLKRIQKKFRKTTLEELTALGAWQQWLPVPASTADSSDNLVHMFDVDRFLSIYNRPVRRRQVSHAPSPVMPEVGVVRNPVDGQIYIVGSERNDTNGSEAIEGLTTLHLIDDTSFSCEVFRRVRDVGGTDADPGHYIEQSLGTFYFDVELRSVSDERDAEAVYTTNYFAFTSCRTLQKNDRIQFPDGRSMMVESPYTDAGFYAARLSDIPDTRKDVVITVAIKTDPDQGSGFNPYAGTDGTTDTTPASYNVTAWVGYYLSEQIMGNLAFDDLPVFIDYENIGFEPKTGDLIVIDGVTHSVSRVRSNDKVKQYQCICGRS